MRSNRPLVTALWAAAALFVWAIPAKAADAPKTDGGLCAECHEQAKGFAKTAHGHTGTGDAACASCHGDGTKHAEAGGDKSLIKVPVGRDGVTTCLSCHDKSSDQKTFRDGVHVKTETVNCLSCHAIHGAAPGAPHLLVKKDPELCAKCHPGPTASFKSKPYRYQLDRGGIGCTGCHEPHGRHGRDSLKETRAGEIACLNCHTSQRGPFVYSHVEGVAGDCMSCHEPHGSSNQKQLTRSRVDQLCLECHSRTPGGVYGSMPVATHNLNLPRGRNCTTCHVKVHGSNSSPKLLK